LCFTAADKVALKEPGNANGGCFHENVLGAVKWFYNELGLVGPAPPKAQAIKELSLTYAQVTQQKVAQVLTSGPSTININDSVLWPLTKLDALASGGKGLEEYQVRRDYVIECLENLFPSA
jgi:hypothetical protein